MRYERDRSAIGWTGAHLIGKDSQRAPLGTYLTFGVTAVLFWILNHGGKVGKDLALGNPVEALQTVSQNPSLDKTLPLADGRALKPVEIQLVYLDECHEFAKNHDLPDWAPGVLERWRSTSRGWPTTRSTWPDNSTPTPSSGFTTASSIAPRLLGPTCEPACSYCGAFAPTLLRCWCKR